MAAVPILIGNKGPLFFFSNLPAKKILVNQNYLMVKNALVIYIFSKDHKILSATTGKSAFGNRAQCSG